MKFGGVDIRQLAEADLRGRVGFLPQDVVLFYGTIRDNIALGDPTINDQMILRASASDMPITSWRQALHEGEKKTRAVVSSSISGA